MTKNDLLNGKRFMLDNEEYQAMIENDDIRSAEITMKIPRDLHGPRDLKYCSMAN